MAFREVRWVTAVMLALATTACTYSTATLADPASSAKARVVGHFERAGKNHRVFFGLVPISEVDVAAALAFEVKHLGGRAAKGVRVQRAYKPEDFVVSLLTGFLYTPTSVTMEGDVIR